ncbi:MAG: DUF2959 family protein [Planctomycetota bacterium]
MKASTRTPAVLPLAALAVLGLGLPACSTTGVARTAATMSKMDELEAYVGKARRSLADTLAALDEVQNTSGTDPGPAFSRFSNGVENVRSTADAIPRRAFAMKDQAAKHDEAWLRETSAIQDPSLRQKAEERRASTMQRFEAMGAKALAVKTAYEPLIQRLRDMQVFLSNDLNPTGIAAIRVQVAGVKDEADGVDKALDALAKEIAEVRVAMSPRQTGSGRGN